MNHHRVDLDRRFVLAVDSMKVGAAVLLVEHADHDAEESRDFRHGGLTERGAVYLLPNLAAHGELTLGRRGPWTTRDT